MRSLDVLLCLVAVSLVSLGQVLLRGLSLQAVAGGFDRVLSVRTLGALGVYAVAMLIWLYVLARVPLTQAFAFFGLCFFFVPLMAHYLHGDPVGLHTWTGAIIIAIGVFVSTGRA